MEQNNKNNTEEEEFIAPRIYISNCVNGKHVGDWVEPHEYYDFWAFRQSVDIFTGNYSTAIVRKAENLPKGMAKRNDIAEIWEYCVTLWEDYKIF